MPAYYIGVDVGTGSARAVLVQRDGTVVASSAHDTPTWRDEQDHRIFEQSTTATWAAVCSAVKDVIAESKVDPSDVKGLGFDATCSLAVTDMSGTPICVTGGENIGLEGERNIILWADHRAEKEAELINSTGSVVLDYVGGVMSLEMEIPKILWLKNRMKPEHFSRCQFFDLPDYLTYRATGSVVRSCCSITCTCSYVPGSGWDAGFFEKIGLGELVSSGYTQIGAGSGVFLTAGEPVGQGLKESSAEELGLVQGTPVGSGIIDAYAGWIGTIGARFKEEGGDLSPIPKIGESSHRLATVAGTSTCHLVQSPQGVFVGGVWGPYRDAIIPGYWMNEGGQSSTGQLIHFITTTHPAYPELLKAAKEENSNPHEVLNKKLDELMKLEGVSSHTELTKDLHMYPDLHGNRSPIADPRMRGSVVGLALDDTINDLARKYNVTMEAIALQTKHIVDEMNCKGHEIRSMFVSGGQSKNLALMQLLANTCNMPVVIPHSSSTAVVTGAAMLGRFAAEANEGSRERNGKELWDIMVEMTAAGTVVAVSADSREKKLLGAKYSIFREAIEIQKRWRKKMEDAVSEGS